jgi:hypothetical protein
MNRYERFKRDLEYKLEKKRMKLAVKTLPESLLSKGDKRIFHGGCIGCVAQDFEGVKRCLGCQYFDPDWKKPDLSYTMENRLERIEFLKKVAGRNNKIDSILED